MMNKKRSNIYTSVSTNYIRAYAYEHGETIYEFMNRYNIGHSVYGSIMDKAALGKHVMAHRLYGHHIFFDLPLKDSNIALQFIEHEFSDLFTKQGLPILPGEVLENAGLLKYCNSLTHNWNFINGFDLLTGTVSIYKGLKDVDQYFYEGMPAHDFESVAGTLGIGAIELAIAISSANPLLLVGGVLHFTSGIKGIFNDGAVYYFKTLNRGLSIAIKNSEIDMRKLNEAISIGAINRPANIRKINDEIDIYKI